MSGKTIREMTWTELLAKTTANPIWAASQLATLDERLQKLQVAIQHVIAQATAPLDAEPDA